MLLLSSFTDNITLVSLYNNTDWFFYNSLSFSADYVNADKLGVFMEQNIQSYYNTLSGSISIS